jgi:predicted DsbA family dithiol-disulfide isomerase
LLLMGAAALAAACTRSQTTADSAGAPAPPPAVAPSAAPPTVAPATAPAPPPVAAAPDPAPRAPEPTPAVAALTVEIWHDTICPWCRIGCHNLHAAIARYTARPVNVVYHPFLLDPDTPEGGADLRERLKQKYGRDPEPMFARVVAAGARHGVSFDFSRVTITPETSRSHVLIETAPGDRKKAVIDAIHAAYFDRGENLGDVAILTRIAETAGLDVAAAMAVVADPTRRAAVRAAAQGASRSGISGVPYFKIGARTLNGAQDPDVILSALAAA